MIRHSSFCMLVTLVALLCFAGCERGRPLRVEFPGVKDSTSLPWLRTIPLQAPTSKRFDPSGLTLAMDGTTLLAVDDKGQQLALFSLSLPTKGATSGTIRPFWKAVGKPPKPVGQRRRLRLDLEGATTCQGAYLVISEQFREVFRLHPKTKTWTRHPLALHTYERKVRRRHPLPGFSKSRNAGFEGIACDERGQRLYVIQERQPRLVFVVKLPRRWFPGTSLTVESHFDLPSLHLPQKQKGVYLEPDFSGAAVSKGHLYLLYRNARAIQKVSLKTQNLVATASFQAIAKTLYLNHRPFGMAEGLLLTEKSVWVLYDNNGRRRQNDPKDRRPVLLEFKRGSF